MEISIALVFQQTVIQKTIIHSLDVFGLYFCTTLFHIHKYTLFNFSISSLIRAESCRFASKLFSFSAGTQRPLVPPDNRKTSSHFFIPSKPGFATFCLFSSCKKKIRINNFTFHQFFFLKACNHFEMLI